MPMIIAIDQSDDAPLYEQLRRQIVEAIANGDLVPGDRLPSVRSLAVDLGINLHTVNKAYAMLRDDGYITMRRGSGATVAAPVMSATAGARWPGASDASGGGPGGHTAERLTGELRRLILEHKALGGDAASFLAMVRSQCEQVYGEQACGTVSSLADGGMDDVGLRGDADVPSLADGVAATGPESGGSRESNGSDNEASRGKR